MRTDKNIQLMAIGRITGEGGHGKCQSMVRRARSVASRAQWHPTNLGVSCFGSAGHVGVGPSFVMPDSVRVEPPPTGTSGVDVKLPACRPLPFSSGGVKVGECKVAVYSLQPVEAIVRISGGESHKPFS